MLDSLDDLTKRNKESLEAAMKSWTVLSKGVQTLAVGAADYSKRSFEQGADALDKILGANSLETAIAAQSDYCKTAYDSLIAESNRVSELCADLAKEMVRPLEDYVGRFPAIPHPQTMS